MPSELGHSHQHCTSRGLTGEHELASVTESSGTVENGSLSSEESSSTKEHLDFSSRDDSSTKESSGIKMDSSTKELSSTEDSSTHGDSNPEEDTSVNEITDLMEPMISKGKVPVAEDPVHRAFMRMALDMAELALRSAEVPVGCVFVYEGRVLATGMNDTNRSLCGTRHAEFIAIEKILLIHPSSVFSEIDLYVTVEPCVMCASALRQLRIRQVFFGCLNDRFGGTGGVLEIHQSGGVDPDYRVHGGIFYENAIMLLRKFYVQENERAPSPAAKRGRELKTEVVPFELLAGGKKGMLRQRALDAQKAERERKMAEEKKKLAEKKMAEEKKLPEQKKRQEQGASSKQTTLPEQEAAAKKKRKKKNRRRRPRSSRAPSM